MQIGLSGCPGRWNGGAAWPDRKAAAILPLWADRLERIAEPAAGPAESCFGGRAEYIGSLPAMPMNRRGGVSHHAVAPPLFRNQS